MADLILASSSPYRRAILESAGYMFSCISPDVDESLISASSPKDLAIERAKAKAKVIFDQNPDKLVIGSDQVLSFNGTAFDKVNDSDTAVERLKLFAGNTHLLHSGVSLMGPGFARSFCTDSALTMRRLTDNHIANYVRTGEWQGSVGCYKIEGLGIHLFSSIEGNLHSIIGLPLLQLACALRDYGIDPLK